MSGGYLPPLIDTTAGKIEFLAANGYFGGDMPSARLKESDPLFKRAALEWQEFAGILPDGDFGPVSQMRAQEKRCALPDLNRGFVRTEGGKWQEWAMPACTQKWNVPDNTLTCCHNSMKFSTLSATDTDAAWWKAKLSWMAVCGIKFKRVAWNGQGSGNFWHEAKYIDGGSSVLAWHYLPGCGLGSGGALEGRFDTGERWSSSFFQAVVAHEDGHGLGLEHSSNSGDLMYPYANSSIVTPQAGDAKRVVDRYGKPTSDPGDPDPPTPPTGDEWKRSVDRKLTAHDAILRFLLQQQGL